MKRYLILILLLAIAGTAGAGGGNLALNGGFETGMAGWKTQDVSGTMKASLDPKTRKSGKGSGHVVKTGGFAGDWIFLPVKGLPGGGKVAVSAWVKGKSLGNCWLKFFVFDAAGASIVEDCDVQMLRGSFDWREISRTFTLPAGAVRGELRLCMFMGGEAWIDDVKVTAPGAVTRKELDQRTRKWLEGNATTVASLDFDAPLTDLAPLKKILKNVRIVQLGESSHGDGETQRAKARLVRFLHEEMGFNVLAFESGMYECDRANQALREGKHREAMRAGLFKIWCLTQTEPLFEYMAERANSDRPLVLAGFDPQMSGEWADRFLDELFEAVDVGEASEKALKALLPLFKEENYQPDISVRGAAQGALKRAKVLLAAGAQADGPFLTRCLENFGIYERLRAKAPGGPKWDSFNLRDGRMGENLKWLAEVGYPEQKIITWAATVHQGHNLKGVSIGGNASFYKGCRAAGEVVHEAFGKKCYTIGFSSYSGNVGMFAPRGNLGTPKEGSIEDTLSRFGQPLLLLNLRKSGPFDQKLHCGPMAHGRDMTAKWSKVLDGLFYIEENNSTTYMGND
jgi:erythromycin esterase